VQSPYRVPHSAFQSTSAWTALTGAHVSWSMGFRNNESNVLERSDIEKLPRNRENVVFSDKRVEAKGLEPSNLLTARYPRRVDWRRLSL